jgi:hypothetical protein
MDVFLSLPKAATGVPGLDAILSGGVTKGALLESELALRAIAMPVFANAHGDIFGGGLLSQTDLGISSLSCAPFQRGQVIPDTTTGTTRLTAKLCTSMRSCGSSAASCMTALLFMPCSAGHFGLPTLFRSGLRRRRSCNFHCPLPDRRSEKRPAPNKDT